MNLPTAVRVACLLALVPVCRTGHAQPAPAVRPPLTAQQRECLKEYARRYKEVDALLRAGKQAEAVAVWQKQVAREREVFGTDHEQLVTSLKGLANLHELRGDFPAARAARREALAIRSRLYGEKDWRVTDARMELKGGELLARLDSDGRKQLAEAGALSARMVELSRAGRPREALPLARRVLALRKDLLGEDDPAYPVSLNNVAVFSMQMGEYVKARALLEQARGLYRKHLGEAHPMYAVSLMNLAGTYRGTAEYAKARDLYEQARDLRKHLLGEGHPSYAHSLNELGCLYHAMGEYGEARRLLEQARDLRKRILGERHPDYASTLGHLGNVFLSLGDHTAARGLLERALLLGREAGGEDRADRVARLIDLAVLHQDTGEYARARDLFEEARDLSKRLLGEGHPQYAASLSYLGGLYRVTGEYDRARDLLGQALALRRKVLGEAHPDCASTLESLAAVYQATGEHGRARRLLEEARDLQRRVLGEGHPRYAHTLTHLAGVYRDAGEYAKARDLLEQARDLWRQRLGEGHPNYAAGLAQLAGVCHEAGEHAKARALLEEARDLQRKLFGEEHPQYAPMLLNLALVHRDMGDNAAAARCARQALLLRQALLDRTFTSLSDRRRLNSLSRDRVFLTVYLSAAVDADTPTSQLYQAVLAWKGALAARSAEEKLARMRPDLRPLTRELQTARAGLAHLASLAPAGKGEQADWRRRFDRLEKEKEDLETLLTQKSATYLRWRNLRRADPADVAAALPPDTALIEFLHSTHWSPPPGKTGPPRTELCYLAFVLVRGRPPVLVPLGPAEPIDKAVAAWRRATLGLQSAAMPAAELSRRVWQPIRKHLGGARTVLIAPDSTLAVFPFAALPGSRPGTYLLEEVAIGYVTSGRDLLELSGGEEAAGARGLVAVGDLRYGQAPKEGPAGRKEIYRHLPGTRLETERIARLYTQHLPHAPSPRLLTGGEIDVAGFKEKVQRPRYLHLATHGLFEAPSAEVQRLRWPRDEALPFGLAREYRAYGRNPLLLSGLVLARANEAPEKGILRAEEVADLDLRGCQLAVLSACDTGLGKVTAGEGVLGLQRAFQAAGVRSLLASLWKVYDAATSVLMEEFYANLWARGLPRLEALRQAQLTVLRDPARVRRRQTELDAELVKRRLRGPEEEAEPLPEGGGVGAARSHPALWAAFVLGGDIGPITEAKN